MQPETNDHGPARRKDPDLAEIIEGVVRRDPHALGRFFEVAGPPVERVVSRALRDAGIRVDRHRLHDIVQDGVLDLIDRAGSWRPDGGAAPWTWAHRHLVDLAFRHVGILADDLHTQEVEERPAESARSAEVHPMQVLRDLAPTRPELAALADALDTCASERDGRVWLEILCEEAGGNRRAAVTVAHQNDVSHANARKIRQRVGRELERRSREHEHRQLAALPALAA